MVSNKTAIVFMADGMEMCECLLTVDILRRAGVSVVTASVMGRRDILSSHQVYIRADALAEEVDYESADMIILPGGRAGTENLSASSTVAAQCGAFAARAAKNADYSPEDEECGTYAAADHGCSVRDADPVDYDNADSGKFVAAICAAPSVLAGLGILDGRKATCHPDFEERVRELSDAVLTRESVVVDGNIITGQGLGATMDFALCLAELLTDWETAAAIADATCYRYYDSQL